MQSTLLILTTLTLTVLMALPASLPFSPAAAEAYERMRTVIDSEGRVVSRTVQRNRHTGALQRQTVMEGPRGKVTSTFVTRQPTHNGLVRTKTKTIVRPNGKTVVRQKTDVYNRNTGTWTRSTTTARPNGRVVTRETVGKRPGLGHSAHYGPHQPYGGYYAREFAGKHHRYAYVESGVATPPSGHNHARQSAQVWDPVTGSWIRYTSHTGSYGRSHSITGSLQLYP